MKWNENKRLYNCWANMKGRCDNANRPDAKYYHGKGIRYCDAWADFEAFADWAVANGYADNLTLDRIDCNGNYHPDNCRWITIAEQQRNKSNCVYLTYKGETKTIAEWADMFGINRSTLHDRVFRFGYSVEYAIEGKCFAGAKPIWYGGKEMTQTDFAKLLGVNNQRITRWKKKGLSPAEMAEKAKELTVK